LRKPIGILMIFLILAPQLPAMLKIHADTVMEAIVSGVKWLIGMQRSDGSWPDHIYVDRPGIYNTWKAMQALLFTREHVKYREAVSKALQYLNSLDPGDPMVLHTLILYGDPLSRLSDPRVRQGISKILKAQNPDGSWGDRGKEEATAFHLWILSLVGMEGSEEWRRGLEYVYNRQLGDGSWVLWWTGRGDPGVTCTVVLNLLFSGISGDDPHIRRAISFIKSSQSPSGGWQATDGYYYIEWTARCLIALSLSGETRDSPHIQRGLSFLLTYRNPDGSFHNYVGNSKTEIYVTSQVLMALGIIQFGPLWLRPVDFGPPADFVEANLSGVVAKALKIAKSAASFTISKAEPADGGYRWLYSLSRIGHYNPVFNSGAAGVGYFLAKLYELTGESVYLKYAEGAARWIMGEALLRDGGYTWPFYDDERPRPGGWYLTPGKAVGGVAEFFLELYWVTGKREYLDYAENAARWIINTAFVKSGPGSYVKYNPYGQAAFGIYSYVQRDVGFLMIHLYRATGKSVYLDKAREIAEWVVYTAECNSNICKWYDDRGYKNLYTVTGMVALADYLYEVYNVTGEAKYFKVAEGFLDWIESVGVKEGDMIKFPDYIWIGGNRVPLTIVTGWWDHIWIMTPADAFLKSYLITKSLRRLSIAESYARWLISASEPEYGGLKIPSPENKSFYHASINARVFNFIVKLYTITGRQEYLDYAYKLLTWIETTAVEKEGYSWPIWGKDDTTFPLGSSSVGYYIIDAINALTKPARGPIGTDKLDVHVKVLEPVPFNRLFDINVTVTNRGNSSRSLEVALDERTGFQAGVRYGDGDEVKSVFLAPGESVELSFKAKVYGGPRVSEEVVVRVYTYVQDLGGLKRVLVLETSNRIRLRPEFANMTTVITPPVVRVGEEFTVAIPVFYSFHSSAGVTLTLRSLDSGRETSQSKSLKGDGLELYEFRVGPEFMGSKSPGVKGFEVVLRVGYPEEGYWTAFEERLRFNVTTAESAGNSAIRPMWGYTVELELGGERYLAVMAYNASSTPSPRSANFADLVKQVYSTHNWLVFRKTSGGLEVVRDDGLYKMLAMAAETVRLRVREWSIGYLDDRYRQLIWIRGLLAIGAEATLYVFEYCSRLLGVIVSKKVEALASPVLSSLGIYNVIDPILKSERLVELLKSMNLYENMLESINNAGGVVEDAIAWLSIMLIYRGAGMISEANKLLRDVGPSGKVASVEDALKFYQLFTMGDSMASAGSKFLVARYEKRDPWYLIKTVLLNAIGGVGRISQLKEADEFYETLKSGLGAEEVIELAQYLAMAMEEYEIRSRVIQEKALEFRDAFIRDTSNSIKITLLREGGVRLAGGEGLGGGLYLAVVDSGGMISGFDPVSGSVRAEIKGSYVIDGGGVVAVIVPLNTTIKGIRVVSTSPEGSTERFRLRVELSISGETTRRTEVLGELGGGRELSYSLKLSESLDPLIAPISEERRGLEASPHNLVILVAVVAAAGLLAYMAVRVAKSWNTRRYLSRI